jgi:hypothetical protein
MLVLALVCPFAALGFLLVMQGFERWMLGAPPAMLNSDAIAGMTEDDSTDRTPSIRHPDRVGQPRLSAVASQADFFVRVGQQNAAPKYSHHGRHAA